VGRGLAGVRAAVRRHPRGGPPDHAEAAYIPASRVPGGVPEDAWFTYSLSALTDDEGACLAVYNVAVEVTGRVQAERQREAALPRADRERERLRDVLLPGRSRWPCTRAPSTATRSRTTRTGA
jgi:predicted Rdx family selenoprotein